jgi:hypothetical protein
LTSGDNPLYIKDDFIELDSGKYQLKTDSLEEAYQKSIN